MARYSTEDIRNIALVGHGHAGKTTLADLILFKTGGNNRAGSVDDGSSLFDTDDDEKERKSSITSSVGHATHDGKRINLIDTPGFPDFLGQVAGTLQAVETAAIVVNAAHGIEVNTRRVFQMAGDVGAGRVIVLTKLDAENIDFATVIQSLRDTFGMQCIPINVPDETGSAFSRVFDTLTPEVGGVVPSTIYHEPLVDAIVEADDELMEKYMETMELSAEEAAAGITNAIVAGTLIPIFCVSGKSDIGVTELLDGITSTLPSPGGVERTDADGNAVAADASGPLIAQVFKTRIDPFVAKMNFLRVFSGTLKKDSSVKNIASGKDVKISALNEAQGNNLSAIDEAIAGDLLALVKIEGLHTSDSLGEAAMPTISFPKPMVGLAIEPKTTADQQKISGAINKVVEEDPTISVVREEQTHEMVLYGMSDLHLNLTIDRIAKRDKVGINTHTPRIPYRETCTGSAEGSYRHKKQSGGSGQFAEVHFKVSALPREIDPEEYFTKARFESMRDYHYDAEKNYAFVDRVTGGSVPNQFIPAVEKGIVERMTRGVVAGYQVQDCVCELFFGKDHPVDSNETAFKTAASKCFSDVFNQAKPVLLEPIVHIEITIPADKMGDITADLTTRRGRMEGMDAAPGGFTVVKGFVPLSEVQEYARGLSSMTGGQGSYLIEPSHYEVVPSNEQQKIIAAAQHTDDDE
ncbi:MAG: elongation factor G [Planctomycetota bacterium]